MIERLHQLDTYLFLLINGWYFPELNRLMEILSGQIVWAPMVAIFLWIAFKKLGVKTFFIFILFLLLAVILSDVTSSYIIKNIVERMRPCRLVELKPLIYQFGQRCGGKYGFVSSHAANSTAIVLFSLLALELKSWKYYLIWILPLIVSYSRIYLGAHYPGDIIGGVLVGLLWGSVFAMLFLLRDSRSKSG